MITLRFSLTLFFLTILVTGENTLASTQLEEEEELLSLSEDEEMSSDFSSVISFNSNPGLRGSHSISDELQVDEEHRATGIKYKPIRTGSIFIQSGCTNILTNERYKGKSGAHNKLVLGPVTVAKNFNGQSVSTEMNSVNKPDQLSHNVGSPLILKGTTRQVFARWKCPVNGPCGLELENKGQNYKGEGGMSFDFQTPQKKISFNVYSKGSRQVTVMCYNRAGQIIGENNAGFINGQGNTKIVVSRTKADIKGCSMYSLGTEKMHFRRKITVTGLCVG